MSCDKHARERGFGTYGRTATLPLHSNREWIKKSVTVLAGLSAALGCFCHPRTRMGFSVTSLPESLGIVFTAVSWFFVSIPPQRFCSLRPNLFGHALLAPFYPFHSAGLWILLHCPALSVIHLWICSPRSVPGDTRLRVGSVLTFLLMEHSEHRAHSGQASPECNHTHTAWVVINISFICQLQ